MALLKRFKDRIIKIIYGKTMVPAGLFDLSQYFRNNSPISFDYKKGDNVIIAVSTNFRYGSIVTSGKDQKELDKNIKDAILTSFEVPSSYANEAKIHKVGEEKKEYALA